MAASITQNIASHLAVMAGQQPDRTAVLCPARRDAQGRVQYTQYTFRELDDASSRLARGFERIGIRRGTRTALLVPPSLDFFALTFALFKLGAVPVLIDPGIGLKQLGNCLAEAEPQAFIGIPKAHAARVLLRWAPSVAIPVTVGAKWFWGGHTLEQVRALAPADEAFDLACPEPDETAAILFTSGSTGAPKGVVYTHEIFTAQVGHVRALYGIEPGEVDLPTFPLFALFGPALGMTEVLPEMDPTRPAQVDPVKIIAAIERFGVTNMFGSPAVINRVGRHGEAHGIRLPTLRRAISAGAPVPAKVLARFARMLPPGAQVFTPYGATECLPVSSIGSEEILGETRRFTDFGAGVCVGQPVPGLTVKIISISDEPISRWSAVVEQRRCEVGEIVVKGPHVTRSYFNKTEAAMLRGEAAPPLDALSHDHSFINHIVANAHAKISDRDGTFWHRMGDVGYLDKQGRLWFCGRKSHRVVTSHATFFTIPCEAIFNTHPAVFRTALVGVTRAGEVESVICVELEPDALNHDRDKLRAELRELAARHSHTQAIKTFLFHPGFPVDIRHNAKIFREKLAVWADQQLA